MKSKPLLLFVLLFMSACVYSQTVSLRTGSFLPAANLRQATVDSFNNTARRFAGQRFAVIQFDHLPLAAEQLSLQQAGITLLDYLPQNAYTVSIRGDVGLKTLQTTSARSLFQLLPVQKMQETIAGGKIPSWAVNVSGTIDLWISFPKTVTAADVVADLKSRNVDVLSDEHKTYRILAIRIAAGRISEIAGLPYVDYVQPAPPPAKPLNYNSRTLSRATILNASIADGGHGLNGEGVAVGVGDNADVQAHIDFSGRLINRNASPFNSHGTHVTGTVAGAGNVDERYRGYAPKATVISQGFSGIVTNAAVYANEYGMVVTNNSYGDIIDCSYDGTYDLTSRILDQQALDLPSLLHVFSSGNSGGDFCGPYARGYHTVLGGYQSAKNVVTVGATTDSNEVAFFSSRGPVKDGRVKPEIVAMGRGVVSAWPTNSYSGSNGTSTSSPAVAGGLALLYQRYRQLQGGANPKNGLMKALLCNGGADRGLGGPDYQYGFGTMNLLRCVEMLNAARYFSGNSTNGSTTTHSIIVPAGTAQVKALLYWNDLPAALISSKALVNDLDLELTTPSGTIVLPKILDTAALATAATTGVDRNNNLEQIVIDNPVAGTYTLRVKGSTVTNAQQEYFLVWDAIPTGVKLTAPAGGQGMVPGESTKISWDAYGLSGTAALEFSADGGGTWTTINNSVDVNRGTYTWTMPNLATHNAVVRITKAGSGETSASNPFIILGQPVVSLSSLQCEGYANISWTAVAGAADYEVMILRGDEMKTVATTTATNYVLSGLSKDSVYWMTVRARINGRTGRRAIAVSRQPNNGTCAGTISDNDLRLEAVVAPTSGRLFTSTQLSATQPITVRIKNLDDAPATNFAVSYTINGTTVTETVASIAANATLDYTFTATANFSAAGNYALVAWVANTPDPVRTNDTVSVIVKQIDNAPINLTAPFFDNLEPAVPAVYTQDTIGLGGIERYDFFRTTPFGRARTFFNNGIAYSGNRAITLDADRYTPSGNTSYLHGTFNLAAYTAAATDVRLDFRYLDHGQLPNPSNRVWIRGSDTQSWIEVMKLDSAEYEEGTYRKSQSLELSSALSAAGQVFTSSFGVRWGQWGQFQATDKQQAAGYTFDDIRLYQVNDDVQMVSIDAPIATSCGLSATAVKITVRNASPNTLINIPVSFRVNGGTMVTETIASLAPRTAVQYTFLTPVTFNDGANSLQVFASFNTDNFRDNDTASLTVFNQPVVNNFPYLQNFEGGNDFYYTDGKRSSWEYGTPASIQIRSAASGAKAWKTRLNGSYNDNEYSYLYTPCFDLTGLTAPTLSFSVALDIEDCGTSLCDGAWVEYSTDGQVWTKLGSAGSGTNWYNKSSFQLWSVQNYAYWHVASQALPIGASRLRLRFVMASDPGVSRDGLAIDDIHIYDNTAGLYDAGTLASPIVQSVSSTGRVDFTSGGKLVASLLSPTGSLGTTAVQAYVNTGGVRSTGGQYYHDRSFTIKPTNNLSDSVTVRLYFPDGETEALLRATTCAGCSKPESAYRLGVSKYTDADKTKENGSIADNASGLWQFLPPDRVVKVPFDKGYYAEFKTVSFSEFWLNGGGLGTNVSLPVKLVKFSAVRQGTDVLVSWAVGSETDVLRYDVEVAKGDTALARGVFTKLGEVASLGNATSVRDYSFTDAEPGKFGARYYRLKIINASGNISYSDIRPVVFADGVPWQVAPNPSAGRFNLLYQLNADEVMEAQLFDAKGRLLKTYSSRSDGFPQKLHIDISTAGYAAGVYLLRVQSTSGQRSFKLYKQ